MKLLRAGGLVIGGGSMILIRIEQLAALTVHYAVPAITHAYREFAVAGGLLSYGTDNR